MKNAYKRLGLGAPLALVAASLLAMATTSQATAASAPNACGSQIQAKARAQGFSGVVQAVGNCPNKNAAAIRTSDTANGTPPLLFHGGPVMDTKSTGPLVVTPIFWSPPGHPMSAHYKLLLTTYLGDVARASGQNSNVFSVAKEYYGINGKIRYQIRLGAPILDSHPLPADGCQVASTDTGGIYADNSGYNACLDDAQVQAETDRSTAAHGLPHNLSHIYVLYLPKHVESCFNPGSTTTSANECTINYQPSAAYCAYHNDATSNAIYANMPYPVYLSKTGFTCGTDVNFPGVIESPNSNPDADTEDQPDQPRDLGIDYRPGHRDRLVRLQWLREWRRVRLHLGQTKGSAGHLYNQEINGRHFLTQEEFQQPRFRHNRRRVRAKRLGRGTLRAA